MNRLAEIVSKKRERVAAATLTTPREAIERLAREAREPARPHRLREALNSDQRINIIAEFKRRSPSKGIIRADANPKSIVAQYERAGAAAISILTEQDYFAGSMDDLQVARGTTTLPLLRKDFIIDPHQGYESAAGGA